jgi:hypothetical protein
MANSSLQVDKFASHLPTSLQASKFMTIFGTHLHVAANLWQIFEGGFV